MSKRARSRGLRSIGGVLPGVVRRLNLGPVVIEQQVIGMWPRVVGDKVARHSRAVALTRGVLRVEVDSPAWMTQLMFLKSKMINRLAVRVQKGTVRDVRFVLADGPTPPEPRNQA